MTKGKTNGAMAFGKQLDWFTNATQTLNYSGADFHALVHIHRIALLTDRKPILRDFYQGEHVNGFLTEMCRVESPTIDEIAKSNGIKDLYGNPDYRTDMLAAYAAVLQSRVYQDRNP